jgi:hypothetical protein
LGKSTSAGEGDALLVAAGELAGSMGDALGEARAAEASISRRCVLLSRGTRRRAAAA